MANPFQLLVLPGDGNGPEVVATALSVFERLCRVEGIETEIRQDLLHGSASTEQVCEKILSALN